MNANRHTAVVQRKCSTVPADNLAVRGSRGEWLARTNETREILVADTDLHRIENVRRVRPFFRDRRLGACPHLLKRYGD